MPGIKMGAWGTGLAGWALACLLALAMSVDAHDEPVNSGPRGFGPRITVALASRMNVAVPGDLLVMTNGARHHVSVFDLSHDDAPRLLGTFGERGSGVGRLDGPHGAWLNADGAAFVLDTRNRRVQVFDLSAIGAGVPKPFTPTVLRTWGRKGSGVGELELPASGLVIGSVAGGSVYVGDTGNDRVQVFTLEGEPTGVQIGGRTGTSALDFTSDIALDEANGVLYVVQPLVESVAAYDSSTGQLLFRFGTTGTGNGQFLMPSGVAIDKDGSVFIVDRLLHRVLRFGSVLGGSGGVTGVEFVESWGHFGRGPGQLLFPQAIAVDSKSRLYIVDITGRGQVFDRQGKLLGTFSDDSNTH